MNDFFSGLGVAILGWLGSLIKALFWKPSVPVVNDQRVVSNQQSGGITAHTVNIGEPKRQLQSPQRVAALQIYRIQAFGHVYGDSLETSTFWNNLLECLKSAGWTILKSAQHSGDHSIQNVVLQINASVPDGDESSRAAAALNALLKEEGITSRVEPLASSPLPPNSMFIRVGPNH
jgi:hypothetical protein